MNHKTRLDVEAWHDSASRNKCFRAQMHLKKKPGKAFSKEDLEEMRRSRT